jgi:glycosyltransferase involved in cell wall biosynthesis
LKVLEAMSSGTPVVSTSLGAEGLMKICFPALLVADSPEAFAAEVCRVISGKAFAEKKSLLGRQIVLEHFDWSVIGRKMEEALEDLLGSVRTKCSQD